MTAGTMSFGEELKRERELREISLREVSEATKISMKFLQAIEENQFDLLPGGVFNVGFIRSYAKYIGVDDDEMVNNYLFHMQQLQSEAGEDPSLTTALGAAKTLNPDSRMGWVIAAIVAVVVAAGLATWYFFFR